MSTSPKLAPWPPGLHALRTLSESVLASDLDRRIIDLVRLRASQINDCAYCIDMHSEEAQSAGENEQRLNALTAWRDTPLFDERERAALRLTESVTELTDHEEIAAATEEAARHFDADQLTQLVYAIIEINAWNALMITTKWRQADSHQPQEPAL